MLADDDLQSNTAVPHCQRGAEPDPGTQAAAGRGLSRLPARRPGEGQEEERGGGAEEETGGGGQTDRTSRGEETAGNWAGWEVTEYWEPTNTWAIK